MESNSNQEKISYGTATLSALPPSCKHKYMTKDGVVFCENCGNVTSRKDYTYPYYPSYPYPYYPYQPVWSYGGGIQT